MINEVLHGCDLDLLWGMNHLHIACAEDEMLSEGGSWALYVEQVLENRFVTV